MKEKKHVGDILMEKGNKTIQCMGIKKDGSPALEESIHVNILTYNIKGVWTGKVSIPSCGYLKSVKCSAGDKGIVKEEDRPNCPYIGKDKKI